MDQTAIPQPLERPRKQPSRLVGNKGYSSNRVRDWLRKCRGKPWIPRRDNERLRHDGRSASDKHAYNRRSITERTIG